MRGLALLIGIPVIGIGLAVGLLGRYVGNHYIELLGMFMAAPGAFLMLLALHLKEE